MIYKGEEKNCYKDLGGKNIKPQMSLSPKGKGENRHHTSLEDKMREEMLRHAVLGSRGILSDSRYHTCEKVTGSFSSMCRESEIFDGHAIPGQSAEGELQITKGQMQTLRTQVGEVTGRKDGLAQYQRMVSK